MGQLAVNLFTTLDGSAEHPDRWHGPYFDTAMGKAVDAHIMRCDGYLMGRVLHDAWAAYWPQAEDPFAEFINRIPKYVLSTTLESSPWENTQVLSSMAEVKALKERTPNWIGMSGSLAMLRGLLTAGLVDELDLLIDPVVVSGEQKWTDGLDGQSFSIVSHETFDTGAQHLIMRPN